MAYRLFQEGISICNDSGKTLINETLCRRLGLKPETAPGTMLYTEYKPDPISSIQVIGVMKDFNYSSLHNEVKPLELDYEHRKVHVSLR